MGGVEREGETGRRVRKEGGKEMKEGGSEGRKGDYKNYKIKRPNSQAIGEISTREAQKRHKEC